MQVRVRGLGSHARHATPRGGAAPPRRGAGDGDGLLQVLSFAGRAGARKWGEGMGVLQLTFAVGYVVVQAKEVYPACAHCAHWRLEPWGNSPG